MSLSSESAEQTAIGLAKAAKAASHALTTASTAQKNQALEFLAQHLLNQQARVLEENAKDIEAASAMGLSSASIDRLRLTPARIEAMVTGLREVIALQDPVGRLEDESVRPNGLKIARMRIPLGVICIIYESRPNVTIDAGALCIKSGNTPILKGGKEAFHSNMVLVELMREALAQAGLPKDCVQAVASSDRAVIATLIRREQDVDLVIPRGGESLIRYVTENATVPVIQHYKGVCHVYVHADADLKMAEAIVVNAKVSRPGVCNALETLLVHEDAAQEFFASLVPALSAKGVELRGDARAMQLAPTMLPASESDWDEEYLALILAVKVVSSYDEAVTHIRKHSSNHTESIITRDLALGERFLRDIQSSCVMLNASTRFNDGFELGLGAEIGISTSKLHAYGPMGLEELTARKFIVLGQGQTRG